MEALKLCESDYRFMCIIWENEPLASGELVKLCESELHWKRTTTYTVLKKLGERGLFHMENGVVTALISREDYYAARSEKFVDETFEGSLPAFIAAFTRRKGLSAREADEIRRMIDAYRVEE